MTQKINVMFKFQEVNKPHMSQKDTANYKIHLALPRLCKQ